MIRVSEPTTQPPQMFHNDLQKKVYECLYYLHIPFLRVENDPAITMEDCIQIDAALQAKTVKTLFLCNRQQTNFYLFITPADKPFVTKDFSRALEISRVSFAPSEQMEQIIGTKPGAATVFGTLLDSENKVQVVIDRSICRNVEYAGTDGTYTGYLKVPMAAITEEFLKYVKHKPIYIDL